MWLFFVTFTYNYLLIKKSVNFAPKLSLTYIDEKPGNSGVAC